MTRSRFNAGWTRILWTSRKLGRRRILAIGLFALLGFMGSSGVAAVRGLPLPGVSDEFSYLLAADTFAEGRLTNPTHPHWQHFEALHVIHKPSYQSKYPPGQGLILALGQRLGGFPAFGIWLSSSLLCAALAWALLMWLPAHWALISGFIGALNLSTFEYWAQSYWGGNMAAIGGCLLIGALAALIRRGSRFRTRHGILLGAGIAILALSRPFEGLVATGAVLLVAVGHWFPNRRTYSWIRLARPISGMSLMVLAGLGFLAVYNDRVSGSPTSFPYQIHEEQYAAAPTFLWETVGDPPEYRHEALRLGWLSWGAERHRWKQSVEGFASHLTSKISELMLFYLGPAMIALLGLTRSMRGGAVTRGRYVAVASIAGLVILATLSTKAAWPHYAAPATCALFVLVGGGLIGLHRRARRQNSLNLAAATVVACLAALIGTPLLSPAVDQDPQAAALDRMDQQVRAVPGPHLVLVRHAATGPTLEWIRNRADIDRARVVWARAMNPAADARLLDYFDERSVWHLVVRDGEKAELRLVHHATEPEA